MAEITLTTGAKWAIERLDELRAGCGIGTDMAAEKAAEVLTAGVPLSRIMTEDPRVGRVLQAALTTDALAHVLAPLQAQANALGARTVELDQWTLGSRGIR